MQGKCELKINRGFTEFRHMDSFLDEGIDPKTVPLAKAAVVAEAHHVQNLRDNQPSPIGPLGWRCICRLRQPYRDTGSRDRVRGWGVWE